MKKLKYLFIIVATVMLSASCSDDGIEGAKESGIVGSWEQTTITETSWSILYLTFNSNGTGSMSVDSNNPDNGGYADFTWETEGTKLKLNGGDENDTVTYSISGNELTLYHQDTSTPDVYIRK